MGQFANRGSGVPVVLTPGGMWGGHVHRVVAAELARDFRVISWDRRNTDGKSGIIIEGDASLYAALVGLIEPVTPNFPIVTP